MEIFHSFLITAIFMSCATSGKFLFKFYLVSWCNSAISVSVFSLKCYDCNDETSPKSCKDPFPKKDNPAVDTIGTKYCYKAIINFKEDGKGIIRLEINLLIRSDLFWHTQLAYIHFRVYLNSSQVTFGWFRDNITIHYWVPLSQKGTTW